MRTTHHHHHHSHLEQRRGAGRGERWPGFGEKFGPGVFGFPGGGPGFGPGFGPGTRGRHGGRGRARRGDVRSAILALLAEAPSNGYGLIRTIGERTEGAWRPSPGSVYPTLAQLVDEGLVEAVDGEGARSEYRLTDAGRAHVEENADQIGAALSAATADDGPDEYAELFTAVGKLLGALRQVAAEAGPEQRAEVVGKLDGLRRELYRMLAE